MSTAHRVATPAVLLALALVSAGSGCGAVDPHSLPPGQAPGEVKVLRIQLPSFDEAEIQGIWLWRLSEATQVFQPISEIRLGSRRIENGQELIEYELLEPSGASSGITLSADVDRSGAAPQLALWVIRFGLPGEFKATVYNAAGESPLSAETIVL